MTRTKVSRASSQVKLAASDEDDLSLAERVYKRIREGIRMGEFHRGQRLREEDLARKLNVSRTPVREAIRRLSADGLVEVSPSRGMRIIDLDKQQMRELYSLRQILEKAAARLAAQHASLADIAAMEDILVAGKSAREPAEVARLNRAFHRAIREASHNRYLESVLAQLSDSLALLPGTSYPGRPELAHREHREILAAIKARDAEKVEQLMHRHIELAGAARVNLMFEEK